LADPEEGLRAPPSPPPSLLWVKKRKNYKRKKSRQGKQNKTGPSLAQGLEPPLKMLSGKYPISSTADLINQLTAQNVCQAWERSRDQIQTVFLLLVAIEKNMLQS